MTAFAVPSSRATSDFITAAIWDADVVDNFTAIGETWLTYTPTLTAVTVNPTLGTAGNGAVQEGRYKLWGKFCVVSIGIKFASTGGASGTGNYIFSLPADPKTSAMTETFIGDGTMRTPGTLVLTDCRAARTAASACQLRKNGLATSVASGDYVASLELYLLLRYEVA